MVDVLLVVMTSQSELPGGLFLISPNNCSRCLLSTHETQMP